MQFVTIGEVRQHCKADSADDAMLTIYADAAEAAVVAFLNRNVYLDSGALATAIAAVDLSAVHSAYEDAIEAADALDSELDKQYAIDKATITLHNAQLNASMTNDGMVINKDIKAAILLLAAHFNRNREAVTSGQGASAVEVPFTVESLLRFHRKIGPL